MKTVTVAAVSVTLGLAIGAIFGAVAERNANPFREVDLVAALARPLARIATAPDATEKIREDARKSITTALLLIAGAGPDLSAASPVTAINICVLAKHDAEILPIVDQTSREVLRKYFSEVREQSASARIATTLGEIDPCLQSL